MYPPLPSKIESIDDMKDDRSNDDNDNDDEDIDFSDGSRLPLHPVRRLLAVHESPFEAWGGRKLL